MYSILKAGMCFLSVRWSDSAHSFAAALRNEEKSRRRGARQLGERREEPNHGARRRLCHIEAREEAQRQRQRVPRHDHVAVVVRVPVKRGDRFFN